MRSIFSASCDTRVNIQYVYHTHLLMLWLTRCRILFSVILSCRVLCLYVCFINTTQNNLFICAVDKKAVSIVLVVGFFLLQWLINLIDISYRQHRLHLSCLAVQLLLGFGLEIALLCPTLFLWWYHHHPCRKVRMLLWIQQFVLLLIGQPLWKKK